MTDNELKRTFIDQVLYNAAQKTGDTTAIMPELKEILDKLGMTETAKKIEDNNRLLKNKELENKKTAAAAEIAKLAGEYNSGDQNKKNIIDKMHIHFDTLKKTTSEKSHWERKTAAEICATDYPPLQWVVPSIIPEGLTIIHGSPKVGKSWLALQLAIAVSTGGYFLGNIEVDQKEVLLLSLEDNFPRIKERIAKQGNGANSGLFIETAYSWNGGIGALNNYVNAYPSTGLIIIDTLIKFAPMEDSNDYSKTYKPLSLLQEIAAEKRIPIVLIHHTRKGANNNTGENWADEGMGSQGFNGAVDNIIFLQKKDGKKDGAIFIKGRDIEEKSYDITFDSDICSWRILGESEILRNEPKAQAEILSLLEKNPEGLMTKDITSMLGKKENAICNTLKRLEEKNRIEKKDNIWVLFTNSHNSQMNGVKT